MKLMATLFGNNSANLYAWGSDNNNLGIGNVAKTWRSPNQLHLLKDNLVLESYESTVFITDNNSAMGCGNQGSGQLGIGDTTTRYYFTEIPGSWKKICVSVGWSLGLKTDGTLWHAGNVADSRDGAGGTTGNNTTWTQIGSRTDWDDISIGYSTGMAKDTSGISHAWGTNSAGQCAQGNFTSPVTTPSPMVNGENSDRILMLGGGAAIIKDDQTLWTTGSQYATGRGSGNKSSFGQVGSDTYLDVQGAFYSSLDCVVALLTDNTAQVWGYNMTGCPGANYNTPQVFDSGYTYQKLIVIRNQGSQCAIIGLVTDGTLRGQGTYAFNGLGGSSGYTTTMAQIGSDNDWIDIYGRYQVVFASK